ncbi:hypothetical protein [Herbiconiux sp. VKM Ac-2851]|uniref:hypothetical protein n=1 Tax=Herbiconiux sp. VKM Ac-2851 TaxID=2739025 RepID=UPI0015671472|nr:hypothetical protein [Herbiconiux sp. VKM Ac-2851]NQX36247.1 hypothetical protein [Herbiconiux sp. VKM Ac-2851]
MSTTVEVFSTPGELPFALLVVDEPAAATLRIDQTSEGRTRPVRGAIGIEPGTPVPTYEIPFNVPVSYRAELFATDGTTLGFTTPVEVTLLCEETWVHQPLDPSRAATVDLDEQTAEQIERPTPGELRWAENASLPRRIGKRRRGIVEMPLVMETHTEEQATALSSTLGDGEGNALPSVLCIRTPGPEPRIPRLLFAAIDVLTEVGVNVSRGGRLIRWTTSVTEALPAAPGLNASTLSYDDIDAAYVDYDAADDAYASYDSRDTDYSLAGTAP